MTMTTTTTTRVPDKNKLSRYLEDGLTQAQIVEAWEAESGMRVSRSAIGMAIERYGLKSAHARPTYRDLLPWRLALEHQMHDDARKLRLEARRRRGERLSKQELRWVNSWLEDLADAGAVVHYERDTEEGFWWIPRTEAHGDDLVDRSNADYR